MVPMCSLTVGLFRFPVHENMLLEDQPLVIVCRSVDHPLLVYFEALEVWRPGFDSGMSSETPHNTGDIFSPSFCYGFCSTVQPLLPQLHWQQFRESRYNGRGYEDGRVFVTSEHSTAIGLLVCLSISSYRSCLDGIIDGRSRRREGCRGMSVPMKLRSA